MVLHNCTNPVERAHFHWLWCNGTDLVRFVMSLDMAVSWGCLAWVTGRLSIHVMWLRLTYSLSFWGLFFQALILLGEARFITWHLRHLFLGECQWGLRHFWKCLVCVSYGFAPGPKKKGLVPYSDVWWGVRQILLGLYCNSSTW